MAPAPDAQVKNARAQNIMLVKRARALSKVFCVILVVFLGVVARAEAADAATLHFSPSAGVFAKDTHFTVGVMVSTNQAMNGVDAVVQFPTDKVQVISVSKANSIFNLWVQEPSFSNLGPVGTVHFQGVKLNPGFTGTDGKVLDIIFRVKDTGLADVTFANGAVLANDGRGTNLVSSFGSGIYTLREGVPSALPPPAISVNLPPRPAVKHFGLDQDGKDVFFNDSDSSAKWSNRGYAKLAWVLPSDVTGVSILLNDKPDSDPGPKSDGLVDTKVFPFLDDGKHYLHIRFINRAGPGPALHYPILVDSHPPKYFNVEFANTEANFHGVYTTSNPRPWINFFTTDDLSGVSHYEIKIGNEEWKRADAFRVRGEYRLPRQIMDTKQTLLVRAIDLAGNFTDAETQFYIEPIAPPRLTYVPEAVTSPAQGLEIDGLASPHAQVDILVESRGSANTWQEVADENGRWHFFTDTVYASGLYNVRAKQSIDNGGESRYTDPVRILVTSNFFGRLQIKELLQWAEHLILIFVFFQFVRILYLRKRAAANAPVGIAPEDVSSPRLWRERRLVLPPPPAPRVALGGKRKKKI